MSKAKDIARAKSGSPHFTTHSTKMVRTFICAHCHKPMHGQMVKVDEFYFHDDCKKVMIPLSEKEKSNV